MPFILLWPVASLLIGLCGVRRKLGFWGYFFVSLFLSPLAGLFLLFASDPIHSRRASVDRL